MTGIPYADKAWNFVTGCDRASRACDNCWALAMAKRLKGMGQPRYQRDGNPHTSGPGFAVTIHADLLGHPLHWRKPRRVFVCAMSDLFHPNVPDEVIIHAWAVMTATPQHTYLALTKRPARMRSLLSSPNFRRKVAQQTAEILEDSDVWHNYVAFGTTWPLPNVLAGVTVEDQEQADKRIPVLLDTPAANRWLSVEPLLERVTLPTGWDRGTGWVVCGGEAGHGARPMNPRWARSIRDQCTVGSVPFYFKQWGAWSPAPWKLEREPDEGIDQYRARSKALDATHAFTGGYYRQDGRDVEGFMELGHWASSSERDQHAPQGAEGMRRSNPRHTQDLLDGQVWDQYPEPAR